MNSAHPLKSIIVILVTGTALGIGSNLLHPKPIPWKGEKPKTVTLEDAQGEGQTKEPPAGTTQIADPPTPVPNFKPIKGEFGKTEPSPGEETPGEVAADLYPDIPESDFPIEVRMAKTKEFYDRGGLLVLDARDSESYAEGHIRGAVYADAEVMIGEYEWMEATAADPRPIMVYCDGGECELSMDLGLEFSRLGHKKVLIFMDGFPSWKDAGYPVDTGEVP